MRKLSCSSSEPSGFFPCANSALSRRPCTPIYLDGFHTVIGIVRAGFGGYAAGHLPFSHASPIIAGKVRVLLEVRSQELLCTGGHFSAMR